MGPAGIPDANGPGLVAMVEAAGGDPRVLGIAKDRLDDVKARLCAGLVDGADAIIVSGGVSVGPYDVVREAFASFGSVELWRVAVQPGKPFAFGTGRLPADRSGEAVDAAAGTDPDRPATLLFGLPGNPVSSLVSFELLARPGIRQLMGHPHIDRVRVSATAEVPFARRADGKTHFFRVVCEPSDGGGFRVRPAGGQGSHQLAALAAANGLAVVPDGDGVTLVRK